MKYLNYLWIMLAAVGFVACSSNDDEIGTNTTKGVTVSMADTDITFSENRGFLSLPFEVKGERDGYVTVTCTVDEYGSSVAMENVHYLVTSYTVNVAPEDSIGYFEIKMVDDTQENENRQFIVTLEKAVGAEIAGVTNTVVTIKDNDSDPYERMGGQWVLQATTGNLTVMIDPAEEDNEEEYGKIYRIKGMLEDTDVIADFRYNEATHVGTISIAYNQDLADVEHSTYGHGVGFLGWLKGNSIQVDGNALFSWGEDPTVITLDSWAGENVFPGQGATFSYLVEFEAGYFLWDNVEGATGFVRAE